MIAIQLLDYPTPEKQLFSLYYLSKRKKWYFHQKIRIPRLLDIDTFSTNPQHSLTKNQSIRRTINHGHEKNTEKGNVIFQQQDEKDTIELPSQLSYR